MSYCKIGYFYSVNIAFILFFMLFSCCGALSEEVKEENAKSIFEATELSGLFRGTPLLSEKRILIKRDGDKKPKEVFNPFENKHRGLMDISTQDFKKGLAELGLSGVAYQGYRIGNKINTENIDRKDIGKWIYVNIPKDLITPRIKSRATEKIYKNMKSRTFRGMSGVSFLVLGVQGVVEIFFKNKKLKSNEVSTISRGFIILSPKKQKQ